jgi:Protein of unknown function (DUF982)
MPTGRRNYEKKQPNGLSGWGPPVEVNLGRRQTEILAGPADALSFMVNRWPSEKGDSYLAARHLCSAFLRRKASGEEVRSAFVAAATEAGLLA